ncbi:MAG: hypothetical protein ACLSFE_05450, partial [Christensenellales bacterium]
LSAKDTFQRPPATRLPGISQIFLYLRNTGNADLATAAENFLFPASPTYYGRIAILPNGQRKKQQIFFRLTAFRCRR